MKEKDNQALQRVRKRAWAFAQWLLGPIFRRSFRFTADPLPEEGPYLLVCNHAANADPILVSLASRKRPLSFVASEHLQRLGLLTKLLTRYFSIIPRSKASSGAGAVKGILRALRQGEPVLLFAEGDCCWDGVSGEVFPATGKLARTAKVPLVTYRLEGNYLSKPRWAKNRRRGFCHGRLVHVYSAEELAAMSPEAVTEAINRDIYENAWETLEKTGVEFVSKAPARGLERAFFLCPGCRSLGSLTAKGQTLVCKTCGQKVTIDGSCRLQEGPFTGLPEWDRWQQRALRKLMKEGRLSGQFPGKGVLTTLPKGPKKPVRYSLDLKHSSLVLDGTGLPLSEITDMAMVKTNRLLFTHNGTYYELRSKTGVFRPYLLCRNIADAAAPESNT